jgi:Ca2+-binding EF-hand superfamily protein
VQTLLSRVREQLTSRRLNWLQAFATFDRRGDGVLTQDDFGAAIASLNVGLSQTEVDEVWQSLCAPGGGLQVAAFHTALSRPPTTDQAGQEEWMSGQLRKLASTLRETELSLSGSDSSVIMKVLSTEKGRGSLREDVFLKIVCSYIQLSSEDQVRMVLLCPKNLLGEVDIATTVNRYLDARPPTKFEGGRPEFSSGAPPTLPFQNGMANANGGRLPPLPHSPTPESPTRAQFSAPLAPPLPLGSKDSGSNRAAMARLRHRLRTREAPFADVFKVFCQTQANHLSAAEFDAAASALPLGLSRQEARQIHRSAQDGPMRVDALIPLDKFIDLLESASRTEEFPAWGVSMIQRSEGALTKGLLQHDSRGTGQVQPSAFRMILMRTERYLTAGQLDHLLAWADKDADGNVDYRSFLGRGPGEPLGFAGLACPPGAWPRQGVAAVLRRAHRKLVGRQVSSLGPCARLVSTTSLSREEVAALLSRLPIGLSSEEAGILSGELQYPLRPAGIDSLWQRAGDNEDVEQWAKQVMTVSVADRLQSTFSIAEFAQAGDFRQVIAEFIGTGHVDRMLWLADKDKAGAVDWTGFCERWCGASPTQRTTQAWMANGAPDTSAKPTPASMKSSTTPTSFRAKTAPPPADDPPQPGCCGFFRSKPKAR